MSIPWQSDCRGVLAGEDAAVSFPVQPTTSAKPQCKVFRFRVLELHGQLQVGLYVVYKEIPRA